MEPTLKKRTLTIEGFEDGQLRVTVEGPPFIANGHDLSSRTIRARRLTDFAPADGERPEKYSSAHCTEHNSESGCHGMCHHPGCEAPAEFFMRWKAKDGHEDCVPVCKWHARDAATNIGMVVLNALQFGATDDLRFWVDEDVLPDGQPRCSCRYDAANEWGEVDSARCTIDLCIKNAII
jgi:hypothetical protein